MSSIILQRIYDLFASSYFNITVIRIRVLFLVMCTATGMRCASQTENRPSKHRPRGSCQCHDCLFDNDCLFCSNECRLGVHDCLCCGVNAHGWLEHLERKVDWGKFANRMI